MSAVLAEKVRKVYRIGDRGRWYTRRGAAVYAYAARVFEAKHPWEPCLACQNRGTCNCSGVCAWCTCTCDREREADRKIVRRFVRMLARKLGLDS